MASPRILNQKKKKKSIQRIRNETHHVAGKEIKPQYCLYRAKATHHVAGKEIKPQYCLYRAKAKQTPVNQTQRCLSKKKKKKSPIHKPKPNPSKPNPVTHDHIAAARSLSSSSLAPHRRSLCLCSGAPFGPPSRYFSLFFSYSLSLSH